MDEQHNNSLGDFATALGSDLSSANQMMFSKRYGAITLNRALLSSTYMEDGIIQVLVDQPIDDAFRGGILIKCDELNADDIAQLNQAVNDHDVLHGYTQALKWMRLFGGAGVIINAGQDTRQPFNIERIKDNTPLSFLAVDRWELSYPPSGIGAIDQLQEAQTDFYNYYGHDLHFSNVIKLRGKEPPSLIRTQFSGWGMSELEKIVRSYNQYLKHQNVTYELLDEAKIDVFSVLNFNSSIATKNGAAVTAQRFGIAAQIKNYQNALVLDAEDKYEQKTMNFAGLSEMLTQIRIGLACDLRMPMTKLFGISSAGFNSGEDDIENYNCMIETEIRSKVKRGLILMLKIVCQKTFGFVPEQIDFDWHPLREMSSQEQSIIKNESLSRVITGYTNGLMTAEKAVEVLNHTNVFELEIPAAEAMSLEDVTNLLGRDMAGDVEKTGRTGRA
jgi:phage-related protein (TIGR01555 family)